MKPVLTLVGRPNVGKSTLFNRLTGSRAALVSDFPGLTRDRQYGAGRVDGRSCIVVDTGGLSGGNDGIDGMIAEQAMQAIKEADRVLLLVDGRSGLTHADEAITGQLRASGRPLTLVVNKTEHLDPALAAGEFAGLGIADQYCISSTHGTGVSELLRGTLDGFPPDDEDGVNVHQDGVRIAVIGRPNVGKSTLVNRILGEERMLTFDAPGTTRDSITVPFVRDGRPYTLIDTAGVRRRSRIQDVIEKFSVIKSLQAIEAAAVVLLVLDARQGIGEQDARLLGHAVESGRALVVAVNKWDGLDTDERNAIRTTLERKLSFIDYATVHYISALHGSGVGNLFESIDIANAAAGRSLPTPMLTRLLQRAVEHHAPPLVRGRRIKLRYAHQGGFHPPVVVVHGGQAGSVPDGYRRYLERYFRNALDLAGTPVRIEFRTASNPYRNRGRSPSRKSRPPLRRATTRAGRAKPR